MSAELVVKKRGRPKKVVQEAEIEIPDSMKKKTTTRAKSTKTIAATATAKPTKAGKTKVITSAKTITASPATSKTVVASKNAKVTKTIAKIEAPTTVNHPEKPPKTASATATRSTPITTTTKTVTSKISSPTLSKAFEPQEKPTIIAPATAVDENTTEAHQVLEKAAPHEPRNDPPNYNRDVQDIKRSPRAFAEESIITIREPLVDRICHKYTTYTSISTCHKKRTGETGIERRTKIPGTTRV
ncbi:hypothetical protein M7I_3216 [Glarea lozoyensis 74030]|uniref:Uncharacterized protein n=1 Tax=Glarea lozoyensis (strain ATCC 74030 / MF5533) TaxID=1104152 RepID=H0EKY2_GLAL7|nr:hypothetical protein M7I_3216 [Glarea lozoyensis 74030]